MNTKKFKELWSTVNNVLLGVLITSVMMGATPAFAVVVNNTASGDIAGNAADLDQTGATIDLDVLTLGLVKTAWLTDGTQLANNASVSKGTRVRFMIYVDNTTDSDVDSLNVSDNLAASFGFEAGSIRVDSTITSGSTEAQIYSDVMSAGVLDDGEDGTDVAGYNGGATTVTAGSTAGNVMVTVPRQRVWAMIFEVTVQ